MLFAASGLGQTPAKEPDALQSLLTEVQQLRKDIEAMTVASQRVQIALYSLQMQDGAVGRAEKRLDEAPAEVNLTQSRVAALRGALDGQTMKVQTCQAAEAESSNQLRNEQAKLIDLQVKIQNLDKTLEQVAATK
jgi:chromosome segregation ATPase